ncbi:MAG: PadR family transcriptional regulator [Firmicutes bacterium]|nr:PadR family transcriptional regulator [Bacillota bacterium]
MKKREENSRQDSLNNFEAQFKRSTIPLLVLQLLSEHEMYAYEMIQETLKRSDGVYKMPLLYTVLNKLEEQGCVRKSRQEVSEGNRVRVYYAITDEGLDYLAELKQLYALLSDTIRTIVYQS